MCVCVCVCVYIYILYLLCVHQRVIDVGLRSLVFWDVTPYKLAVIDVSEKRAASVVMIGQFTLFELYSEGSKYAPQKRP